MILDKLINQHIKPMSAIMKNLPERILLICWYTRNMFAIYVVFMIRLRWDRFRLYYTFGLPVFTHGAATHFS